MITAILNKRLLFIAVLINFFIMAFLVTSNRLLTHDEARSISAGISTWYDGGFDLANDFPPSARMMSVLPLLPFGLQTGAQEFTQPASGDPATDLERELVFAATFDFVNPLVFNYYCLARMMGCVWWLAGAWVIFRWSRQLYGDMAGWLSVVFWSVLPIILEHEQLATPALPAAVSCLSACFAFRRYLQAPTWDRAIAAGLLLGIAQLVDFVALALLVVFPLLAMFHRLGGNGGATLPVKPRDRMLQGACLIGLGLWTINIGYGLDGTPFPLGRIDFSSRVLKGDVRSQGESAMGRQMGNRFRGTWLGRLMVPLPVEYVKGLDRRWSAREAADDRGEPPRAPEVGGDSLSKVSGNLPIGFWAIVLGSTVLAACRSPSTTSVADELATLVPAMIFLAATLPPLSILPSASGTLLATPFLIVSASKFAFFFRRRPSRAHWLGVSLTLWAVGASLSTTYFQFITVERVAHLRQNLAKQGRKLGIHLRDARTSVGTGYQARGLFYRAFLDSQGIERNYALFVPESYRGDRPYPLILSLHGLGDRRSANGGRMFAAVGLPFTLKYRSIDFLVVCPQGHGGTWEADGDDARAAMELLDAVVREYNVDSKRISLTGISSGGTGVWDLAERYPGRWAALVPVASSCNPSQAAAIKDIPCWCFHNRYDIGSPATAPRRMIESLKTAGGNPKYTEYVDTGHRAWERAYVLPDLYDWLARQRQP